jgi:DNA replication protein DnaC
MESVGAVIKVLPGWMDPETWPTCSVCHGKFPSVIDAGDGEPVCLGCYGVNEDRERVRVEVAKIAPNMDRWIEAWLGRAGLSEREREARAGKIPDRLMRSLEDRTAPLLAGIVMRSGFGLRGEAGVGKTFALAGIFRRCAEQKIGAMVPTLGRKAFKPWLTWVRWPEHVHQMRILASRDGGVEEADALTSRLADAEALVIDDLGAERWKQDDWVASMLDLVIDSRFNNRRGVWYTTHLTADEIMERYGQRFWSRLTGDNPMIEVGGRDLRVVR